jgi:hypothetical protein
MPLQPKQVAPRHCTFAKNIHAHANDAHFARYLLARDGLWVSYSPDTFPRSSVPSTARVHPPDARAPPPSLSAAAYTRAQPTTRNTLTFPQSSTQWAYPSPNYSLGCGARRRCASSWWDWMLPARPPSCTSSSWARLSPPSPLLVRLLDQGYLVLVLTPRHRYITPQDSTWKRSSTRTSASPSGTWEARTRSVPCGDTVSCGVLVVCIGGATFG